MRRIGVFTSGGDAPGMNAAIRAVVRKGIYEGCEVWGIRRGYAGLIEGDLVPLELGSVADTIHRGGTILLTARSQEFLAEEGRKEAFASLHRAGIEGLIGLGGEGTYKGLLAFHRETGFPVIGVPATIDNDIGGTDYSIGFDTAVNNVIDAINKVRDTATSHERTFVVEVMGRNTGYIALTAGLAGGAESILVPEFPVDLDAVCQRLLRGIRRGKRHSIIVVAEGVGHAPSIAQEIKQRTGLETKAIILGHIQRGGTPTVFDRVLASVMGARAVELLLAGEKKAAVGLVGGEIMHCDLEEALATVKKIDEAVYKLAEILAI
ncbi:6-phosphofructokinase [Desulfothermobacter acidiphilus]|uniref:6-phosphofructokinase n=1 Tax=Desulfothermobacter acidiphilus TaxID=1938353 RepID=UPI003F8CB363